MTLKGIMMRIRRDWSGPFPQAGSLASLLRPIKFNFIWLFNSPGRGCTNLNTNLKLFQLNKSTAAPPPASPEIKFCSYFDHASSSIVWYSLESPHTQKCFEATH